MMKGIVGSMAWTIDGLWELGSGQQVVDLNGYAWTVARAGRNGSVVSGTDGGVYPMDFVEFPARIVRCSE